MRTKLGFVLVFGGLILFTCFAARFVNAQTAVYTDVTLTGGQELGGLDWFGDHVASSDEWLIIGAGWESIDFDGDGEGDPAQGESQVGAVYVYRRTAAGPVFHQKIEGEGNNVDPDSSGDRFGSGITLLGDWMFVGAANDDDFPGFTDPNESGYCGGGPPFDWAGKVYVFRFNRNTSAWELTQKLASDQPKSCGAFGGRSDSQNVVLYSFGQGQDDPTIALIGEIENATGFPPRLHVFKRKKNKDQWKRVQIADAPSGLIESGFADSVEAIGPFALVVEDYFDPEVNPPVVHVYRVGPNGIVRVNGRLQPIQTLDVPGGLPDAGECVNVGFGDGMSAANGIAIIGNPCDDTAADRAGAVHVYSVDNSGSNDPLTLVQTLPNPTATADSFFGLNRGPGKQSISTDGNVIAVGSADWFRLSGQQDVELFARNDDGVFVHTDSIPSPEPGVAGLEYYGQSVNLLGDGELAISQMTPNGRVFLFDLQGVD